MYAFTNGAVLRREDARGTSLLTRCPGFDWVMVKQVLRKCLPEGIVYQKALEITNGDPSVSVTRA